MDTIVFPALRERPGILKTSTALQVPITVALPGLVSSDKVECGIVGSGIRVPQKVLGGWGTPEAASYEWGDPEPIETVTTSRTEGFPRAVLGIGSFLRSWIV
jgi:hypothetical protein